MGERFLTKLEVAGRFDVSTRTVERWVERGWLPKVVIGGVVRFRPDDVEGLVRDDLRAVS